MQAEGVVFRAGVLVAGDGVAADAGEMVVEQLDAQSLLAEFDAVVLAIGAEQPRDLPIPGRELDGVHFAMDFLRQKNRVVSGDKVPDQIRQRAASVTQIELLTRPPESERKPLQWPHWPDKLRTSSSHLEGCECEWAVATTRLHGNASGRVARLEATRVQWQRNASTARCR